MSTNIVSPVESMTTREIAEVCGKRHDHVVRDLKVLCDDLEISLPKFGECYKADNGQEYMEYRLDKALTLTLTSGYNAKQRHAIISRWIELESMPTYHLYDESNRAQIESLIRLDHQEHKIKQHEKRILALEGLEKDFMSIMGWCNIAGIDVDRNQASAMGKKASAKCRALGVTPSKCHHPVFGEVNTYPVGLLDELFDE